MVETNGPTAASWIGALGHEVRMYWWWREHLGIGSNLCIWDTQEEIKTERRFRRMLGRMDYLASHLARLRQEITELRNINVLYAQQSAHNAVEQTASDIRANRLLQIKQELLKMRECPPEHSVWWDKSS